MKKGYGKLVFAGCVITACLFGIIGCTNEQAIESTQEEGTPSVLDELYAGTMVEESSNKDEKTGRQMDVDEAADDDDQQSLVSADQRAWEDQLATVTSIQELYALATDEVLYDGERGKIRSDLIPEYRDSYRLYREESGSGYHAYIVYLGQSIDIEGNEDGYVHCFGLTVDKDGERVEEGMLLDIDGEKVLVDYPYENTYVEYPEISYVDLEDDGDREVVISQWEFTGTPFRSKRLLVCDQKPFWRVYCYHAPDCIEDAETLVTTTYQEETDCLTFATTGGDVLYELELPDFGEEYPYSGDVRWQEGILEFSAHTFSMDVTPGNIMKNSPTYMPITIRFHVGYENGAFYLMAPELHDPFLWSGSMRLRMKRNDWRV